MFSNFCSTAGRYFYEHTFWNIPGKSGANNRHTHTHTPQKQTKQQQHENQQPHEPVRSPDLPSRVLGSGGQGGKTAEEFKRSVNHVDSNSWSAAKQYVIYPLILQTGKLRVRTRSWSEPSSPLNRPLSWSRVLPHTDHSQVL